MASSRYVFNVYDVNKYQAKPKCYQLKIVSGTKDLRDHCSINALRISEQHWISRMSEKLESQELEVTSSV